MLDSKNIHREYFQPKIGGKIKIFRLGQIKKKLYSCKTEGSLVGSIVRHRGKAWVVYDLTNFAFNC